MNRKESLVKIVQMVSRRFSRKQSLAKLSEEDMGEIMMATGLDRKDVEEQYREFLRSHPEGKMGPSSLRAMLKESLPGADIAGLAQHIWRIIDTNQDGSIDFRELMLALRVMRNGSPEENLRQIFRLFDVNSDGRVEIGELGLVAQELEVEESMVLEAFAEMDTDEDGEVTQEEFVAACLGQRKASATLVTKVIDIFVAA